MNLMKTVIIVIILVGLGLIITAFLDSPWQLQIASALVGLGFICLGLMQIRRLQEIRRYDEKYEQLMSKINEIKQELEKIEQPKGTGVAIADVISSGLKYYTEHMTKQKKEEEND